MTFLSEFLLLAEQVLLDIMHVSFQGTLDSLLKLWTHSLNSDFMSYLNKSAVRIVNQKLVMIKYTSEIRRAQRQLTYLSYFKANELRNFIYYALVYVLKVMLDRIYEHFVLYVLFIRLITKKNL